MNKNTIILNLFGGPCTGKSTGAAYIFSKLKMAGIDAELVTEFAKDKTWENNAIALQNQFYILGNQSFRLSRCYGKVDVIITDSPLLLSNLYVPQASFTTNLKNATLDLFNTFNNINFFLTRVEAYNTNGRNQTEIEADEISKQTLALLETSKVSFFKVDGCESGYNQIIDIFNKYINRDLGTNG